MNSKESLREALKGAYAVFAVTNCKYSVSLEVLFLGLKNDFNRWIELADWENMSKETEVTQGKNIADVAKVWIRLTIFTMFKISEEVL